MNRIQKMSWLMVITQGVAFLSAAIAVTVLYYKIGFPHAWGGLGFLGICGFGALAPVLFRKDPGPVQADERDLAIKALAKNNGLLASYLFFILLAMGIWIYYGHDTLINVNILPMCVGLVGMVYFFIESLTYLIAYRKGGSEV
jgi:hypothetical protein